MMMTFLILSRLNRLIGVGLVARWCELLVKTLGPESRRITRSSFLFRHILSFKFLGDSLLNSSFSFAAL